MDTWKLEQVKLPNTRALAYKHRTVALPLSDCQLYIVTEAHRSGHKNIITKTGEEKCVSGLCLKVVGFSGDS